jgi:hypothetical protein
MPERRGSRELRRRPVMASFRHPQRSPPCGRSAVWWIGRRSGSPTVNIRRNSENCAHRPGEILKPLNNRNASPEEWRGSARRGRQPLTDRLTEALRSGRVGEEERASCWQDVRNSGGFVRAHARLCC